MSTMVREGISQEVHTRTRAGPGSATGLLQRFYSPIEGPHPYLYLDATFLDARWARKVENVSALVAYAVDPDGHRRLPGHHARP